MAKATAISVDDVKAKMAKDGCSNVEETLQELKDKLGGEPIFAKARTPVGTRVMAGVSEKMTHFWDADDGWETIPGALTFVRKE